MRAAPARARTLRKHNTEAEQQLWRPLRNRQLLNCKFRRQHPVGRYFADFASLEAGLIIEVDGGQHFEPAALEADARRTLALQAAGFTVLRFDNRQVLTQLEGVLQSVLIWLEERGASPHPHPLPQAGEGT